MDSIDRSILQASGPREVREPDNVARLVEKMIEKNEIGHVYLCFRQLGMPHPIAVICAHQVLVKQNKDSDPEFWAPVEAAQDIEPPVFMGLN